MRISVEVCLVCKDSQYVNLKRCACCDVLGCTHLRDRQPHTAALYECLTKVDECAARERDRVMSAWIFELLADGYCVTPTGRIDCHGQRLKIRDDDNFVCAFCEKPPR